LHSAHARDMAVATSAEVVDAFVDLRGEGAGAAAKLALTQLSFAIAVFQNERDDVKKKALVEKLTEDALEGEDLVNSPDTMLTREEFRRCVERYATAAGQSMKTVHNDFKELMEIMRLFQFWTQSWEGKLDYADTTCVLSLFNQVTDEEHPEMHTRGRMLINYYDRTIYGEECKLESFTRWVWDEFKFLMADFNMPFEKLIDLLTEFVTLVQIFQPANTSGEGTGMEAAELNRAIARWNGDADWDALDDKERRLPNNTVDRLGYFDVDGDPTRNVLVKEFAVFMRGQVRQIKDRDFNDVVDELRASLQGGGLVSQIVEAFRKWDVAGRGFIDRTDLQQIMCRIHDFLPQEIDALMEGADTNKDGQIDYAKFARWVMEAACPQEKNERKSRPRCLTQETL